MEAKHIILSYFCFFEFFKKQNYFLLTCVNKSPKINFEKLHSKTQKCPQRSRKNKHLIGIKETNDLLTKCGSTTIKQVT